MLAREMFLFPDSVTGSLPSPPSIASVFATNTYSGNSSVRSITNGINLSINGGLVWLKERSPNSYEHQLFDTSRGVNLSIRTNSVGTETDFSTLGGGVTAFNSTGYSLGTYNGVNQSGSTFCSWAFRKSPRFFDIVAYSGNNSSRVLNHNLSISPGIILIKSTNTTSSGGWALWHKSATGDLLMNSTASQTGSITYATNVSTSSFTVPAALNTSGSNYVAYVFADDNDAAGVIRCGSFTTNGSGAATINVGWEPQYLMFKSASGTSNWLIFDSQRGFGTNTAVSKPYLSANLGNTEVTTTGIASLSTGFELTSFAANTTYVYMTIRKP